MTINADPYNLWAEGKGALKNTSDHLSMFAKQIRARKKKN